MTLSAEERAKLPRLDVPPKPVNNPHAANLLPAKYVQTLEYNQKLPLCCRHVEESGHTAQWFASPTAQVKDEGIVPDILIIRCGACNRKHVRFFVGGGDTRPVIKEIR